MAGKSSGGVDGDASKAAGSLEKTPTVDADSGDAGGYDYSDYSGDSGGGSGDSSEAYVPPSEPDGGSGSDGEAGDDSGPPDTEDPADSDDAGTGDDSGGDDTGRDDTGGDDTGGDDPAADEPTFEGAETQPAEPPVESPRDPEPNDPPRPHQVSIDIDLMRVLIAAMARARDQIPDYEHELRTILSDLDLEPSEVVGLDRVTEWLDAELPGMRQRLALAEAIEDGTLFPKEPPTRPVPLPRPRPEVPVVPRLPRPPVDIETLPDRPPVVWDEDRFVICPPYEAADHGRRAAALLGGTEVDDAAQAADLIRTHGHDPYFAREFTSNTDPSFIADTITAAEADGTGGDLRAVVTGAVTTASRATGELGMDDATREAWASALA